MKRYDIRDDADLAAVKKMILDRGAAPAPGFDEKKDAVRAIVDAVRERGDAAVAEFTERFDGVRLSPEQFEVTPAEIDAAAASVDSKLLAVLERAHENIRAFHAKRLRESWEEHYEDGSMLGQRITPIESAGVYVPGGKAFYPSSVLMNIVPARVAGVPEIVMVSPPTWNGTVHPGVLAAAKIAGATRVFRVGGAQAVAALACGTGVIPAVCKITGPGNTYVTAAKALVRGMVDIDSEAGPSEVVVLADAEADPRFAAYELLAQAEHDEEAMPVLITTSADLAEAVAAYTLEQAEKLARAGIVRAALQGQGAVIVTRDMDEAVALTNLCAPEHLSIQVKFPSKIAARIVNAGAMMLGPMTPVAVGDYYAGPNHILPTMRRARHASPLTAEDFRKVTSVICYSRQRLREQAGDITGLAMLEGLEAHARSVSVRVQEDFK